MPHLRLETNLSKDKIPALFPLELNQLISEILGEGKPVELCMVTIVPAQTMLLGTEEGPCGLATFMCFGKFGVKQNIGFSKAIGAKIAEIGIPIERLYIVFDDVKSYNVGCAGTTALELFQ